MQSVGARLKAAREQKGFSLDEINARTRINPRNLSAIEHDEVRSISSPFLYRSFVRQYAETVDLDFRVLAPSVDTLAGHMRQPELPGRGEYLPVRVAPVQPRPKRDYRWVISTAIAAGVLVLCCGGYAAWRYYQPLLHRAAAPIPPAVARAPHSLEAVPTPKAAVPDDKIHLELAATERTWLTVSADGQPAYTGILEPDETKVLEGRQTAKVRTGNAGGVIISFNGRNLGAIGPHGKSRTVVFTKTSFEVEPETPGPAKHIGG